MSGNNNEPEKCLKFMCEMIKQEILKNKKDLVYKEKLKMMGRKVLNEYPNFPEWQKFYRAFFTQ